MSTDKIFQCFTHITLGMSLLFTTLIAVVFTNYPYDAYVYIDISARDLEVIQFGYVLTLGACFPGMAECLLDLTVWSPNIKFLFLYERIEIILSTMIPAIGFVIASCVIKDDPQYFGMVVFVLLIVQRDMMMPPLLNLLISSKSKIWTVTFGYINCGLFFISDALALLAYSGSSYDTIFLSIHWALFFMLLIYTTPYAYKYMLHLLHMPSWDRIWAEEEVTIVALIIVAKYLIQQLLTFAIFPIIVPADHYQATNLTMLGTTSLITAVSVTIVTSRLTRAKLAEKMDEHNTFVRYVGHEVRTPLNISSVCSTLMEELVADEAIAPEVKFSEMTHLLEQQKTAFGLAVSILNDLIDYEKLEKADLALDCSRQNPIDFVLTCTPMFQVQSEEKNITLTVPSVRDREDFLDQEVYIDTYKLGKCLRNFISNAYKFTPAGGSIVISVTKVSMPSRRSSINFGISSKVSSNSLNALADESSAVEYIRVAVTDSGVGISEENLPKMFNEVVQFDPNRLQEGKGSGLGLYMAKGIADLHKIRLHASSQGLNMGTTIAMDIPVAPRIKPVPVSSKLSQRLHSLRRGDRNKVMPLKTTEEGIEIPEYTSITFNTDSKTDEGVNRVTPPTALPPASVAVPVPVLDLTGRKLLIVDDSVPNAKVLAMLFTRKGALVETAFNGKQAVEKVQASITSDSGIGTYYFILMDYNMPVMTGPEACKAIRAIGYTNPIYGLTGNTSKEERAIYEESGAVHVFIKPLDMLKFTDIAGQYCRSQ